MIVTKMNKEHWEKEHKECPLYTVHSMMHYNFVACCGNVNIIDGDGGEDSVMYNNCEYEECPFVFWSKREVFIR